MFKILYSDKNIAVCIKPAGVSSEGEGMPLMLKKELEKGGVKTEVYPLHRLDVPVGGVMVFALNKAAAAELSEKLPQARWVRSILRLFTGRPKRKAENLMICFLKTQEKTKAL